MPVYTYTTFDDPLNTSGDGTLASGINDTGQIVGTYADASGVHGFLLSGGSYTTLDDPLASAYTSAAGINGAGQIVGIYFSNHFGHAGLHGFLYNKGVYTTLDHPLATDGTEAVGINAKGEIVGFYGGQRRQRPRLPPERRFLHHPRRSIGRPPHCGVGHRR
jgi:probable HAF family extracellular repeat protein